MTNKFVRSTWILSLVWTAKFYAEIYHSYKRSTKRSHKAIEICFMIRFEVLSFYGYDSTDCNISAWIHGIDQEAIA